MLDAEFPACAEQGIGFVIGAPYQSGILATGAVEGANYDYAPADAEVMEKVRRIEAVCARHDVPIAAAALQFPLGHPSVASVIPGARNAEQARGNAAAEQLAPVAGDALAAIRSVYDELIAPQVAARW